MVSYYRLQLKADRLATKQYFPLYFQRRWFLLPFRLIHFFEPLHQLAIAMAGVFRDIFLHTQCFGDICLVYLKGKKYPSLRKRL